MLLKLQTIEDIEVNVVPPTTLNTTKGVVVCVDLLNCPEEELATQLVLQVVIACRRLTARRDGQTLQSASYVLNFNRTTVPEKVRAGMKVFIPHPMQCF